VLSGSAAGGLAPQSPSRKAGQEQPELAARCSLNVPRLRFGFRKPPMTCGNLVGDTGFEPVTSSV